MKRTCLGYAALFLLMGGAGALVLVWLLPPSSTGHETPFLAKALWALGAGMGCSLFVTLAVSVLKDTASRLRDRAKLGDRFATALPLDGEKIVACGTLVADGPLLTAPFSATRCAVYWYQVKHSSGGSRSTEVIDAWGYALTPSRVEAQWGAVRLLSYLELDFPPSLRSDDDAKARALAYMTATPLVPLGLGALGESIRAVRDLMADEDGSIRGDFGSLPSDFMKEAYQLYERVVLDRDPVCGFGIYAADRSGLLPNPTSRTFLPVRLARGTAAQVRRGLLLGAIGNSCFAAVLVALAATIVWVFFRYGPEYL